MDVEKIIDEIKALEVEKEKLKSAVVKLREHIIELESYKEKVEKIKEIVNT